MNELRKAGLTGDSLESPRDQCAGRCLLAVVLAVTASVWQVTMVSAADQPDDVGQSTGVAEDPQAWSALRYVPKDAYFLAGVRPRDLLQATELQDVDQLLAALVEYGLGRRADVLMSDVEQLVVVGTYGGARLADYNAMAIVELQSREAVGRLMEALFGGEFDAESDDRNGRGSVVAVRQLAGALLGERTVLLGQPAVIQNWNFSGGSAAATPAAIPWPVRSAAAEATHAFAVFDVERLRRFAPRFDDWMLSEHVWLAAAAPLLRQTRRLEVVARGENGLQVVTTVSTTQEALADIEGTLRAGATILRNVLSESLPGLAPWSRDVAEPTLALAREVLRLPAVGSDVDSATVRLTLKASREQLREFRAVIKPLAGKLEVSARRALRSRNLQRIGEAMLAYYGQHRSFPLAALSDDDTGECHSWRVALLPFLGEQALFERYRRDEPWSSSANQEVLRKMPDVYRHVDDSPTSYRSAYYGLTGPGTAFGDGHEDVRLRDFRDGVSNTIVVVESRQGVPWTKPSDIEVRPDSDVPSFGGFDRSGALVLLADTAVTFLPNSVPQASLRAFVTRAGGERISLP